MDIYLILYTLYIVIELWTEDSENIIKYSMFDFCYFYGTIHC